MTTSAPETPQPTPPPPLWRQVGRRAALGLAGSSGAAVIAVLDWWLQRH